MSESQVPALAQRRRWRPTLFPSPGADARAALQARGDAPPSQRGTLFLTLGAAAGIVCAAVGLLSSGHAAGRGLPGDAVARVNGQIIHGEEYQRVLSALAQDRRGTIDDTQRRLVLDRLIDEELLVQRGLELGLARTDTKIRKDLTGAVIDSIVAGTDDVQPSESEVQTFYREHGDFFATAGHLRVRQVWCRATDPTEASGALARAQEAARRLRAGEDFAAVRDAVGDPELAPVPDTPLPATKLGDYLGPTAVRAALALAAGEISDPVRSNTGYHVLQVIERQADAVRGLDDIRPQVRAELRRRAADQSLRAYLDELRARARIDLLPTLP